MRPLRLKISAFASYKDEVEIDFRKLKKGIFLITGDTGAGKTSIFDAISYALFDVSSGENRDGNMLRSKYAGADIPTFVELEFEYRDKIYKIRRNPEYKRLSKRKDADGNYKETTETADVSLIYEDGSAFIGKKSDINKEIIKILGVDDKQFKHIAMIAQGEFKKLLYASSEERRKIFAGIFNTDFYARFSTNLRKKAKEKEDIFKTLNMNFASKLSAFANKLDDELKKEELLNLASQNIKEEDKIKSIISYILEKIEIEKQEVTYQGEKESEQLISLRAEAEQINEYNRQLKKDIFDTNDAKNTLQKNIEDIDKKEKELLENESDFEDIKKAETEANNLYITKVPKLEKLIDNYSKYYAEGMELNKYYKELSDISNNTQKAKEYYDDLYNKFLAGQAGFLAMSLKDGEACPVCGSKSHPNRAELQEDTPNKEEVERAKQSFESYENARQQKYELYIKAKNLFEETKKEIQEFTGNIPNADEIKKEIEKATKERSLLIKNNEIAGKNLELRIKNIQTIKGNLEILKKTLPENKAKFERLSKNLEGRKEKESESINIRIKEYTEKVKFMEARKVKILAIYEECKTLSESLEKIFNDLSLVHAEFVLYENLSNTARGQLSGSIKLDFETYIQRYYFKQIISKANIRLQNMSLGKFALQCKDLTDIGKRSMEGLNLDVVDIMTNTTRDVRTLSGGEGFMAAISMALGLADMIGENTANVKIDTLFIDEGFGSLDDESRRQAVRTLEELVGDNTLIGIISHVTELKEQIDKKLIVKKDGNSSRVFWEGI